MQGLINQGIEVFVEEHNEWPEHRTWRNLYSLYKWDEDKEELVERDEADRANRLREDKAVLVREKKILLKELNESENRITDNDVMRDALKHKALSDLIDYLRVEINTINERLNETN